MVLGVHECPLAPAPFGEPGYSTLERQRTRPDLLFSFSTAGEDYHAPNESFRVHRLWEGLDAWARYWQELGANA